jgi:hypothetical protein
MWGRALRTVLLGQFTDEHADALAARLDAAGIVWWHKGSGSLVRWLDASTWGVRLFVAADRLEDARSIAQEVLADGEPG